MAPAELLEGQPTLRLRGPLRVLAVLYGGKYGKQNILSGMAQTAIVGFMKLIRIEDRIDAAHPGGKS
jgi:hypothetical protein